MDQEELQQELEYVATGKLPEPTFSKILVRMEKPKREISAGGIEIVDSMSSELKAQAMCTAHVVALGPYVGYRRGINFVAKPAKPGQRVRIYKHSGTLLEEKLNGFVYRSIEDLDIDGVYINLEETK